MIGDSFAIAEYRFLILDRSLAADRELEWKIPGRRQRWLGWNDQLCGDGAALQEGYATASTDTGHKGGNAAFAIGHPEKVIDFAYRAVRLS